MALQNKITSNRLLEAIIMQLNKDFYLANVNISFSKKLTLIQLYEKLENKILDLFKNEYDTYLNLIYRIDVSENKLKKLKVNDIEQVIKTVTLLVLEREFQKILLRSKFQ